MLLRTTLLIKRALNQCIEGLAIGRDGQTLKALVVVTSGVGVFGDRHLSRVVQWRRGGTEAESVVPARQVGLRRLDCKLHATGSTELVDIRAILVRDPVAAVPCENQTFCVYGDPLATLARTAEAIANIGRRWQGREAGVRSISSSIGIQTSGRVTIRPGQEDSIEILQVKIGVRGILGRSMGSQLEGQGKLVNTRLEVEGSIGIPGPIVSYPQLSFSNSRQSSLTIHDPGLYRLCPSKRQ